MFRFIMLSIVNFAIIYKIIDLRVVVVSYYSLYYGCREAPPVYPRFFHRKLDTSGQLEKFSRLIYSLYLNYFSET